MPRSANGSRAGPLIYAAVATSVVSGMPLFLVVTIAPVLRDDLDISLAALGGLFAVFQFTGAAYSALVAGPLAERMGARRSIVVVLLSTMAVFAGMWLLATDWLSLALLVGVAGATQAQANVAANMVLMDVVRPNRQALFFGIKQSAIPVATMLAGLLAPPVVAAVGWRATALALALLSLVVAGTTVLGPAPPSGRMPHTRVDRAPRTPLLVFAGAGVCASAAAMSMLYFLVEFGVHRGLSLEEAGLMLSLSSVAAIVGRIVSGWFADRPGRRHMVWLAMMFWAGAIGYLVLAHAPSDWIIAGALLGGGLGWGWNGLFYFASIASSPASPGIATGIASAGVYLGAGIGPVAFGATVDHVGYAPAWTGAAVLFALAGVLMLLGRRVIRGARAR